MMKHFRRIMALLLVLLMCVSMLSVIACNKKSDDSSDSSNTDTNTGSTNTGSTNTGSTNTGSTNNPDGTVNYVIQVKSVGGLALSGVTLAIYDEAGTMKDFGDTNDNGMLTVNLPKGNYTAKIRKAPAGYAYSEEGYAVYETGTKITLSSSLIPGNNALTSRLELGQVMLDFTVSDVMTGEQISLSSLFNGPDGIAGTADDKKMVLINFFFTTCGPCVNEIPYMLKAYEEYEDDVAIIALNPYPTDDEMTVKAFVQEMGLTFTAAKVSTTWAKAIESASGSIGYPTNIIIDRYGVVTLIETGGITSQTPFNLMFEFFSADNYEQELITSIEQITPIETPNVDMPSNEEIGEAVNVGDIVIEYFAEDNEMAWPFVIKEDEDGNKYIVTSNSGTAGSPKINSFAQINAKVTLKAGQALAFNYYANTSADDIFYIFVDGKDIFTITGISEEWEKCYSFVALEDGEYEINLLYYKDDASTEDPANDGIMLDDFRIVDAEDIDKETYISRYAATKPNANGEFTSYPTLVVDDDGFIRVGDKNGPYLLAELIYVSQFSGSKSVTSMMYQGELTNFSDSELLILEKYCNYASNSEFYGLSAVTVELRDFLIRIADLHGDSGNENEWLEFCEYFSAYGTAKQIENPIRGLATFCAFETVERTEEDPDAINYVTYTRPIMPRGLLYKFVPSKSGAYRITSYSDQEVLGWVFTDGNGTQHAHSDMGERLAYIYIGTENYNNCTMVAYFEEGKEYYIDIAYYDVYATGTFGFTVDYIAPSFEYFVIASPGPFTFEETEDFNPDTLENMGQTIAGGVDVALAADGYYYVVGTHLTLEQAIQAARGEESKAYLCTDANCSVCKSYSNKLYINTILKTLRGMYERYNEDSSVKAFNIAFRDSEALARALNCIEAYIAGDATKAKEVSSTLSNAISTTFINSSYVNATRTLAFALNSSSIDAQTVAELFDAYESALTAGDDFYHSQGSLLYADFMFTTNIFADKNLQQVINAGALDLSKTSSDQLMLAYISSYEVQYIMENLDSDLKEGLAEQDLIDIINGKKDGSDELEAEIERLRGVYQADKTIAVSYFKKLWGEDYDEYAQINLLDDVLNGIYHGKRMKSDNDQYILDKIEEFKAQYGENNWLTGFVELWGDDFEENYLNVYKVEEVMAGIYHGEPLDYTDDFAKFVDKMITAEKDLVTGDITNPELIGCVIVDKELAELLQILMDKFTFEGVVNSWTKLCFYYLYIGA